MCCKAHSTILIVVYFLLLRLPIFQKSERKKISCFLQIHIYSAEMLYNFKTMHLKRVRERKYLGFLQTPHYLFCWDVLQFQIQIPHYLFCQDALHKKSVWERKYERKYLAFYKHIVIFRDALQFQNICILHRHCFLKTFTFAKPIYNIVIDTNGNIE